MAVQILRLASNVNGYFLQILQLAQQALPGTAATAVSAPARDAAEAARGSTPAANLLELSQHLTGRWTLFLLM